MVVQHNMQAMNANRMLGITTRSQAKATEKLSSGYRINRAADDAAGLSISEKMRKQIKGLDQASTNAQDGISAVQTAEGALTEVHAMLQRMNELAVQAANGTNAESDRQSIQDEIEQLTTEIDRVAETTKFNESYLLKGNGKETTISIAAKDAGIAGELTGVGTGEATFKMEALKNGETITIGSKGYTIGTGITEIRDEVKKLNAGDKLTINGTEYKVVADEKDTDPANYAYTAEELQGMVRDKDKVIIGHESYVAMVDGTPCDASEAAKQVTPEATGVIVTLADGTVTRYTVDEKDTTGIHPVDLTIDADTIWLAMKGADAYAVNVTEADGITPVIFTDAAGNQVTTGNITVDPNSTTTAPGEITVDAFKNALQPGYIVTAGVSQFIVADGVDGRYNTTADTIGTSGDIATIVAGLAQGDKVEIVRGNRTQEIIIGETILNADGIGDNDASIISKEEAYRLIGEELLKASSVGCDPGSDATAILNDGKAFTFLGADGQPVEKVEDAVTVRFNVKEATVVAKQGLQFSLHVGADADESNKIALTIDAMDAASLGIKNMNILDNTGAKATYAIDSIADAIAKVSAQRSSLGAIQNRLEHTIANLDNVVENTTAAESEIRDTDMAEAMVEYSKNNILAQAGQSMLAQANQSTQGVMSLLQ